MIWMVLLAACGSKTTPVESTPPADEEAIEQGPTGPEYVDSEGLEADLIATQAFFATRPKYEQAWDAGLTPVPGLPNLSAQTCGACHQELYKEWQQTVHSQAWIDPQYQAEIGKSGNRWLCLNCHTPLLVQQDFWPVGLVDDDVERPLLRKNSSYDATFRDEGITCAACHVDNGAIVGPGLTDSVAPHPVKVDPEFGSGDLCRRCHDAQATYPGKNFICTFETGLEYDAGTYADDGENCTTCHMPKVERPAAVGGPVRTVAQHWWRGAGIPKVRGSYPPIEANPPALDLTATVTDGKIAVDMTNARAGHMLPTGDPERWVSVELFFQDANGAEVGKWSHRIGQKWTWDPPTKHGDTRLKPKETQTEVVPIPEGAVQATMLGTSHLISKENADYHHLGDYPRKVETIREVVTW